MAKPQRSKAGDVKLLCKAFHFNERDPMQTKSPFAVGSGLALSGHT